MGCAVGMLVLTTSLRPMDNCVGRFSGHDLISACRVCCDFGCSLLSTLIGSTSGDS